MTNDSPLWVAAALYGTTLAICLHVSPGNAILTCCCGVALLAFELHGWLRRLGEPIDLALPFRALSLVTMWVAPALSGMVRTTTWFNGDVLPIPLEQYNWLALPGTTALNIALHFKMDRLGPKQLSKLWPVEPRIMLLLLAIGAALGAGLYPLAQGSMRQPAYLLGQLVYPGLLLAMSIWPQRSHWLLAGGIGYAFCMALNSTFFGELLFWSILLGWQAGEGLRITIWRRSAVLVGGVALLFLLLSVKYDYRRQLLADPLTSRGKVAVFSELLRERLQHPRQLLHPEIISTVVNRFNQGFYTAQTLLHTPRYEPWARGSTLLRNIAGAFVPRCWWPDKPMAGGHYNMKRFAGWDIGGKSVNIGFFGEAYANFSIRGAWIGLAAYGLLFVALQARLRALGTPWIPYLLLPAIQVETDFGIAFNHLVKAAFVTALLFALAGWITRYRNSHQAG